MLSHSGARCTMQQLRISAWAKGRPQRIDIDGHLRPHGLDKATKRRQLLQQFQGAPIQQVHDAAPLREHCRAGLGKVFENLTLVVPCSGYFNLWTCCIGSLTRSSTSVWRRSASTLAALAQPSQIVSHSTSLDG